LRGSASEGAPAPADSETPGPARALWPADLVYDGLGRPRKDAAVLVQTRPEPARVVTIGHLDALRAEYPGVPVRSPRRVIAPAAVNAHTHLDLSRMPLSPGGYVDFVGAVVAHGRAGGRGLEAAEEGLAELASAGVDTVGDIVTDERVLARLLAHPGLRGVAYWEVLGADPDAADAAFEATVDVVRRFRPLQRPGGVRLGLSPHTPHTVSAPLLRKLAAFARAEGLPLQIHVAEDPGELPLHRSGDGPLREAWGPFLAKFRPSGRTPIGYLDELGVLAARPTLVHAVHVVDDDIRRLQRAGCVVVHCPRSNALLGSGSFPWAAYARHGVSVALGTDSRGSSPSLSPVDEWRAAVAIHGAAADPAQLLWAAVKGGHRALGTQPPRVVRGSPADALVSWPEGAPWPAAGTGADAGADAPAGVGSVDDVRGGPD
jgi:aminodeoxyfutalosine deaminase